MLQPTWKWNDLRNITNSIGSTFLELKVKLKAKPYDAKKSCWVPNKATHGYDEGLIESTEGDKVTVQILETGDVSLFMDNSALPNYWSCLVGRAENCIYMGQQWE